MKIIYLDIIDSTNEYLKRLEIKEEYSVVIAKNQTNAKGTKGRAWICSEGSALFSFLINKKEKELEKITLFTGYVVFNVIKNILKKYKMEDKLKYKWSNDIYLMDKKLCGILCEIVDDSIIIGVGININNSDFGIYNEKAISLVEVIGEELNVNKIIYSILEEFENKRNSMIDNWGKIIEDINKYNYMTEKIIKLLEDNTIWKYKYVDKDGKITIENNGKQKSFYSLNFKIT